MPELIAHGRAADVYAHGDGYVLRRYRTVHSALHEAAIMQHVRAHGFPAPEVVEVAGGDMVMERVDGPTMLTDLGKRPWKLLEHARTLAGLFDKLHAIPVPDYAEDRAGGGDVLVHLDLHPDNVMVTEGGPVVIDWSNAGRGDRFVELADLWIVMKNAQPPGGRFQRFVAEAGRGLFLRAFLSNFDRDPIRRALARAAEQRLRDRNMTEVERRRIERFVERTAPT